MANGVLTRKVCLRWLTLTLSLNAEAAMAARARLLLCTSLLVALCSDVERPLRRTRKWLGLRWSL